MNEEDLCADWKIVGEHLRVPPSDRCDLHREQRELYVGRMNTRSSRARKKGEEPVLDPWEPYPLDGPVGLLVLSRPQRAHLDRLLADVRAAASPVRNAMRDRKPLPLLVSALLEAVDRFDEDYAKAVKAEQRARHQRWQDAKDGAEGGRQRVTDAPAPGLSGARPRRRS